LEEQIYSLRKYFTQATLLGEEAHKVMSPPIRKILPQAPPDAKLSSVMLPLSLQNEEWCITFILRSNLNDKDHHSGQLSFPGGQKEDSDIDFEACALREVHEEIGVESEKIQMLGPLSPLYIPVSGFLVYPFVGVLAEGTEMLSQPSEVEDIITVPFNHFLQPNIINFTKIHHKAGYTMQDVPYFPIGDKILWGATSMILYEFLMMTGKWFKEYPGNILQH